MIGTPPDLVARTITEANLAEPPEMVWRALATAELLAEWLGPNTMPPTIETGTRFTIEIPGETASPVACEIIEAVPPGRLSLSWTISDPGDPRPQETTVTFELEPTWEGGTHLRIVHQAADARAAATATMLLKAAYGRPRRPSASLVRRRPIFAQPTLLAA